MHSAVTHASLEDWQYMDVIRKAANSTCADHLVNSIKTIDSILLNGPTPIKRQLKSVFGLEELEHNDDSVSVLEVQYLYCSHIIPSDLPRRTLLNIGKLKTGIPRLEVRNSMNFASPSTALSER